MELTEDQLDWLVEHFVHPGKAWIKAPPLEQSLLDLGLIKQEVFPDGSGVDTIVLSLTKEGWIAAIQYRPDEVDKYYGMFGDQFIRMAQLANVPLDGLAEYLSSPDNITRLVASIRLDALTQKDQDE